AGEEIRRTEGRPGGDAPVAGEGGRADRGAGTIGEGPAGHVRGNGGRVPQRGRRSEQDAVDRGGDVRGDERAGRACVRAVDQFIGDMVGGSGEDRRGAGERGEVTEALCALGSLGSAALRRGRSAAS